MPILRLRGGAGGLVKMINDQASLDTLTAANTNKLIVIDFTATWCGPCQRVAPIFAQLSEQHTDVVFVKVDVDDAPEVAENFGVNCMPTFAFVKEGNKVVHRIEGADTNAIAAAILKYK